MKRLVLLGGGHAQLSVLKRLCTERLVDWEVFLITPYDRQLYSGMLPGWVAGRYTIDQCAISLESLARRAGVTLLKTAAVGLDLERREVICADGRRQPFDRVSIDTGPEPALDGLSGVDQNALPLRPIEGFVARWPSVVERWRASASAFDMLIVGGGAGAVELAFAIDWRARQEGATHVRVTLLDREAMPLHGAAAAVGKKALALLLKRGIRWQGQSAVKHVAPGHVVLHNDAVVTFDACLIVTGAAAPPWLRLAGLEVDDNGFIRVDRTLRSVSHPEIFAAGDVAAYADPRPKSGVFAVRAGQVLAINLLASCKGLGLRDWHPQRRALYLISTGDRRAIASWGPWCLDGGWFWRWKDRIDRRFVKLYSD